MTADLVLRKHSSRCKYDATKMTIEKKLEILSCAIYSKRLPPSHSIFIDVTYLKISFSKNATNQKTEPFFYDEIRNLPKRFNI